MAKSHAGQQRGNFTLQMKMEIIDFQKYAELIIDPFCLIFITWVRYRKNYKQELQNLQSAVNFIYRRRN